MVPVPRSLRIGRNDLINLFHLSLRFFDGVLRRELTELTSVAETISNLYDSTHLERRDIFESVKRVFVVVNTGADASDHEHLGSSRRPYLERADDSEATSMAHLPISYIDKSATHLFRTIVSLLFLHGTCVEPPESRDLMQSFKAAKDLFASTKWRQKTQEK